jgi:hypothetical protein
VTIEHLDEQGLPCVRHPAPACDLLMSLAIVGSRAPGFHHDIASKLQGLMMAVDEITEGLEGGDPQLQRAVETAALALKELNGLLNFNRALTKPAQPVRVAFRELVALASMRVYVSIDGELPDATVMVAAPSTVHGLSLAFDVAAGPGRGRTLAAAAAISDGHLVMTLAASPSPPPTAAESLAIATFVFARDRGELRCADAGKQLVIRLPLAS